jgi:hypothetical protein
MNCIVPETSKQLVSKQFTVEVCTGLHSAHVIKSNLIIAILFFVDGAKARSVSRNIAKYIAGHVLLFYRTRNYGRWGRKQCP